jgi:hypothetical protein
MPRRQRMTRRAAAFRFSTTSASSRTCRVGLLIHHRLADLRSLATAGGS